MSPAPRRILLVYPEIPQSTYWSYSTALHMLGRKSLMPPLGLLTVAALLPREWEARLRDLNVEALTDEDLAWADAVFVSAMIVQRESLAALIARLRAAGKTVVAGGPFVTTNYAEVEGVDHFILGEAERALAPFLRDFAAGRARRAYARPAHAPEAERLRTYFGADADIAIEAVRPGLDEIPVPRFDLISRPDAYKSMAVQASRGCPIGCEFCDIWRRFGRRMRVKPVERVLAEFEALFALGWRSSVFLVDDNFIGDKPRAKELLRALAAWQRAHGMPFDLYTEATLSLADDEELMRLMAEAGIDLVFVGIETPAAESLAETRKHINNAVPMQERVERIQRAGIQVASGFILGFDNDPEDIADRMIATIEALGIPVAMVGVLLALPDTDLHDRLEREGRLLAKSTGNNTHTFAMNFRTRRPAEKVIADYKRVLQAIYPRNLSAYFRRCATLRDRWGGKRENTRPARFYEVVATFRWLARSLVSAYGLHSLRFFFETLLRKPAFLPIAVSLGVQGHHFREITRQAFEVDELLRTCAELYEAFTARLQAERTAFIAECSRRIGRERGKAQERAEAALAALQAYRREILREAERRAASVARHSREAIGPALESLLSQIDAALADFRAALTTPAPAG